MGKLDRGHDAEKYDQAKVKRTKTETGKLPIESGQRFPNQKTNR